MKLFDLYGLINIEDKDAINKVDGMDKRAGGLNKSLGLLKGAAIGAGVALATGLGAALVSGVKGAMEAEQAVAQLDAVLKSTGGAAGVTRDQAMGLADQLERTTMFSAEAALAGQNMLLTFTNIGKEVFPLATQTAADMAQALGTDMAGQSIQLGKALNDPINGITALTRVGVTFTDAQKQQIAAMVQAGDVAGAQSIILQELQKEFGGSAEAAGQTFAGQLEILKNGLGNVTEGLVGGLMPYLVQFVTYLNENMPAIQAVMEKVFSAIGVAVKFAADIFTEYILPAVTEVYTFFKEQLGPVFEMFAQWISENMPQIKESFSVTFALISDVIKIAWDIFKKWFADIMKVVVFLTPILLELGGLFNRVWTAIAKDIQGAIDKYKAIITWIDKAIKKVKEFFSIGGGDPKPPKGGRGAVVQHTRATGGLFSAGDLMRVGERGPELVSFDRGGRVIPMGEPSKPTIQNYDNSIHIDKVEVRKDSDIQQIAKELFTLQQRAMRGGGLA